MLLSQSTESVSVDRRRKRKKKYLVEADEVGKTAGADGIEETEGSDGIDIGGILGHVERDLDMGLGTQIVDLGGEDLGDDVDQAG